VSAYFCPCWICGSDQTDCGHREPGLVVWWVERSKSLELGFTAPQTISGGTETHHAPAIEPAPVSASVRPITEPEPVAETSSEIYASVLSQVEIPEEVTERIENITSGIIEYCLSSGNDGLTDNLRAGFGLRAARSELWGL